MCENHTYFYLCYRRSKFKPSYSICPGLEVSTYIWSQVCSRDNCTSANAHIGTSYQSISESLESWSSIYLFLCGSQIYLYLWGSWSSCTCVGVRSNFTCMRAGLVAMCCNWFLHIFLLHNRSLFPVFLLCNTNKS